MKEFSGKIAVVTGGGTGMGRSLVRQLVEEGCHVATCDIIDENLNETLAIATDEAPQGVKVTIHRCDVASEDDVARFKNEVMEQHDTSHTNLLFNNAGIAGGGSFVNSTREEWERTFDICWGGVYLMTRTFLPLLLNSDEGHIINTSSVNGFWASLSGNTPHTAYSSAKFAVKGFTEALINDFRVNAPHLKASVVMPGHVGTEIAVNTGRVLGSTQPGQLSDDDVKAIRNRWAKERTGVEELSDDQIREMLQLQLEQQQQAFREGGLTSDQAATIILEAVKRDEWRILVGEDAEALDRVIRRNPLNTYDRDLERMVRDELG